MCPTIFVILISIEATKSKNKKGNYSYYNL